MAVNFNKYAEEGKLFVSNLAEELGHPEEISRTGIVLRAVLHSLRERITISESLHLLSQLPMFLKAIYVDDWEYREKPVDLNTVEDFKKEVKLHQVQYGEQEFNWSKSTEDIIKTVFAALNIYVSEGEFEDITAQMPKDLKSLFR